MLTQLEFTLIERVAARAGIAKTTIYRRWRSLDGLLQGRLAPESRIPPGRRPGSPSPTGRLPAFPWVSFVPVQLAGSVVIVEVCSSRTG